MQPVNSTPNYFALRGIDPATYANFDLPAFMLPVLPSRTSTILDFGCGLGQTLLALKKAGFTHLHGADVDKQAIAAVRSAGFSAFDLTSEDQLYDVLHASCDLIIMSHVLEHIPKHEMIPLLQRIAGLLAPGGRLCMMVPNAQSNTDCYWAYEDFTHTTLFTAGSLGYVLRAAGYSQLQFVDIDCTAGLPRFKAFTKKLLLRAYRANRRFWNRVTSSAYHCASPDVFSYEIKVVAQHSPKSPLA